MATKAQIKEFIADYELNTGEKLSTSAAKLLMERQAEHDAEASMGTGEVYVNGINTGFPLNPELPHSENVALALAAREAEVAEEAAQPAAPQPVAGPVLHVKQGLALRGGRGEWYKLLCQYNGRPVAEYIAAGKANPASHYTARSTKCGQPKTPESRLSWFKRAGIVTIA